MRAEMIRPPGEKDVGAVPMLDNTDQDGGGTQRLARLRLHPDICLRRCRRIPPVVRVEVAVAAQARSKNLLGRKKRAHGRRLRIDMGANEVAIAFHRKNG